MCQTRMSQKDLYRTQHSLHRFESVEVVWDRIVSAHRNKGQSQRLVTHYGWTQGGLKAQRLHCAPRVSLSLVLLAATDPCQAHPGSGPTADFTHQEVETFRQGS